MTEEERGAAGPLDRDTEVNRSTTAPLGIAGKRPQPLVAYECV